MSDPAPTRTPPRTGRPARARSLACPHCGGSVSIRANGSTVSAACPSCGTLLDVADPTVRVLAEAQARTRQPAIPLGRRGTLDGTEWEAIGYQVRSTDSGAWSWEEWLLFNPYRGFRFLAADHGDWTLYELLRTDFGDAAPKGFRAGEGGTARTDYVLGEFTWRVRVGDEVEVQEYVAPPQVLSRERSGDEVTWSRGTRLAAAAVAAAWGLPVPAKAGLAGLRPLWRTAAAACGLLLLLHVVRFGQARDLVVMRQDFTAAARGSFTSAEFDLPGRGGSAQLEASTAGAEYATVHLRLLPMNGGHDFPADFVLGGGFGGATTSGVASFSSVPGGRYAVAADIDSSAFTAPRQPDTVANPFAAMMGTPSPYGGGRAAPSVGVSVLVRRHPVSAGNFWITLLLLLGWPGVVTAWRLGKGAGAS